MEIVRADFKKNCTVFELIEELFDDRLADYLDEYLENRDYIEDYPDHIMMSSKGNIVEFSEKPIAATFNFRLISP